MAPRFTFGIVDLNFANGLIRVFLRPRDISPNSANLGVGVLSPDDARQTRATVQD